MLRHIGNIYYHQDQFDTALQHEMQSLNLAEKSLDTRGAAASCNSIGLVHFYREEFEEAVKWFKKDKGIAERISDMKAKITSYGNLGMVYQELQEDEKAQEYYERALNLAEELEDPYYTTYLKMKIAHLLLQRDDVEKARLLCEGCLEIFEQLGETLHYGEFCRVYGMILHEIGKWEEARGLYERSMEELSDSPLDLGKTYLEYSLGLKKEGDTKAEEYYSIALQLFEKVSAKREMEKAKKRWESKKIT
jgi:tetratricopeptide (TPR) repeat protein